VMVSFPKPNLVNGYSLSLGDGNKWWLTGEMTILPWLNKLGTIMKLGRMRSNGSTQIIFCSMRQKDRSKVRTTRPELQDYNPYYVDPRWISYDLNTIRVWHHEKFRDLICEMKDSENTGIDFLNMRDFLLLVYQEAINAGGLPFHAGLVKLKDQGILLAAASGGGKSTSIDLLPEYYNAMCDDETLVVFNKLEGYLAHPFPTWSDYIQRRAVNTWNAQYSVPISAVFFLRQSRANSVTPLGEGHSAVLLMESASQVLNRLWWGWGGYHRRKLRDAVFNNACKMAKKIPAFKLRVSLHGRFWEKIEEVLRF